MQDEGFIAKILYPDGTKDIPVGAPICILVEEKDDIAKFKDFKLENAGSASPAEPAPAADASKVEAAPASASSSSTASAATSKSHGDRVVASPYAHKLANEKGVSLDGIIGTGPNSRIIAADVLEHRPGQAAPEKKTAAAASPASLGLPEYEDISVTGIRKVIA